MEPRLWVLVRLPGAVRHRVARLVVLPLGVASRENLAQGGWLRETVENLAAYPEAAPRVSIEARPAVVAVHGADGATETAAVLDAVHSFPPLDARINQRQNFTNFQRI